jgi:hypothetical protein
MKVLKLKAEDKGRSLSSAPIPGDRIGDEAGMPKGPGFGDNQVLDFTGVNGSKQIDRWMVKEETRRMFKAKYGALADKKIKETADRLKRESFEDMGTSGLLGMTPNSANRDDIDFTGTEKKIADQEKTSLFGKKRYKKYKNTK